MSMLFMMGRPTITQTFTSNATWVAPATTSKIIKVEGKGSDGVAPAYNLTHTVNIFNVTYYTSSATGMTAGTSWTGMQTYVNRAISEINNNTMSLVNIANVSQYSNNQHQYAGGSSAIYAGRQTASAANVSYLGAALTSGAITGNGSANLTYNYLDSGSYGTASTAFGQAFPSGTPSVPAAPLTTFTNITVTPSTSYNIVVPSGGYVKITYLK